MLLPGVQLVFGFLLAAPFAAAFDGLTTSEHFAYVVAFAGSALAATVLWLWVGRVATRPTLAERRGQR